MNLKQVIAMLISIFIVLLLFLIFQATFIQGMTIIILIVLGVYIGISFKVSKETPHPMGSW